MSKVKKEKKVRKKELNFISSLSLQPLIECAFILLCQEFERAPHLGTGDDNTKPIYSLKIFKKFFRYLIEG